MGIFTKEKGIDLKLDGDDKYSKFYINDFINDFENQIKGEIFATDEDAKKHYLNEYGEEEYKSSMKGFVMSNSLRRVCPKKLTKNQKIKLLLLLKETNCDADVYMSYQDILELKKDTN